ncbi:MAG: lysylphosphatidylglycerol synthase transmembrane domain-containing protein [bacterium]
MTSKKIVSSVLKIGLTAVVLYFLYRQVALRWQEIRAYEWQLHWGWLALSVVVGIATFFLLATIWRRIIKGFGHELTHTKAFRIFYLSDLGRYIPGKIWPLLGILYLAQKEGIPPERAGASFVLVQLYAIPASFLVFVAAVLLEPKVLVDQVAILGDQSAYIIAAVMLAAALVIVVRPQWVLAIGNIILRKLKRPPAELALDKKVALGILVAYCLAWSCYGLAFWLFVRGVGGNPALHLIAAIGVFNAAYQIGYLALFAPGGFGPRELVLGLMLTPFLGPVAPAVAIGARLWAVVIESLAALLALMVRK